LIVLILSFYREMTLILVKNSFISRLYCFGSKLKLTGYIACFFSVKFKLDFVRFGKVYNLVEFINSIDPVDHLYRFSD